MISDSLVKHLVLNAPQALVQLINANKTYCAWGRGTGKTSGVHGPRFVHLSELMPRCQIGFVTDTYERFHGPITKGIEGFVTNEMGLAEGVDFIMFKKPPEHWTKPLYPIRKFDHVISFATGVALIGGSMAIEGSMNGDNFQAMLGDEMKFVKQARLTEAKRALRGAKSHFGHLAEYRSEWYTTDKYGEEIWWFLEKRKQVNHEQLKRTLTLALHAEGLKNKMAIAKSSNNENDYYKWRKELIHIEQLLGGLRKTLTYFSEASVKENIGILGKDAYDDLLAECRTQNERDVALDNKDPDKAEAQFYPTLSEDNKYESSCDYQPGLSLIITLDWQWRLTPIVVSQISKLPGNEYESLNFIDCLDSEVGIEDALQQFCERYQFHPYRDVIFLYDHTAVGKKPDGIPFRDRVLNYMIGKGWNIRGIHMGQAPDHSAKHENTKAYLTSNGEKTLRIRINKATCRYLITSMQFSATTTKGGITQKDKDSETNLNIPARLSTHYSDCFDQTVRAIIELDLVKTYDEHMGIMVR